jgi:hypothetical protein
MLDRSCGSVTSFTQKRGTSDDRERLLRISREERDKRALFDGLTDHLSTPLTRLISKTFSNLVIKQRLASNMVS